METINNASYESDLTYDSENDTVVEPFIEIAGDD